MCPYDLNFKKDFWLSLIRFLIGFGCLCMIPASHVVLSTFYSSVLFDLVCEDVNLCKLVESSVISMISVLNDEWMSLSRILENPLISNDRKWSIFSELDKYFPEVLMRFIKQLVFDGKSFAILSILTSFIDRCKESRGMLDVEVISPVKLSDSQLHEVASVVCDGIVSTVSNTVDPSILGGVVVKFGFTIVDLSLSSAMKKLLRVSRETVLSVC